MANRFQALFIALLVMIALAGLYWTYQQLPWRIEEVDNGFTAEARRNPFLAAELFLKRHDVPVNSARGLSHLNDLPAPQGATLLIYSSEGILNQPQTDKLWRWVEQGGHLIINTNTYNDLSNGENRSPLFQRLGLVVQADTEDGKDRQLFNAISFFFDSRHGDCMNENYVMEMEFENEAEPLKVALNSNAVLENQGELESIGVANSDGIQLMRYFIGAGMATLVTDMGFWSNQYIACYDHAYLLWKMISDGEVLILSHAQVPSLFSLMWQQAALSMSLFFLLLAAWLWHRSRRFGPLIAKNHSQRRSLTEHLHASAMFAWRNNSIDAALDDVRQSIRARMIQRHPGYKRLTGNEQSALIARLTGIDAGEVNRVMTTNEIARTQQLTELVQRLQQIRNRL